MYIRKYLFPVYLFSTSKRLIRRLKLNRVSTEKKVCVRIIRKDWGKNFLHFGFLSSLKVFSIFNLINLSPSLYSFLLIKMLNFFKRILALGV